MKFTNLDPRWLVKDGRRVGVAFRVPTRLPPNFDSWSGTMFAATPLSQQWPLFEAVGLNPQEVHGSNKQCAWTVLDAEGKKLDPALANFETLTLAPSINIEGVWHGFIVKGRATSV